MFIAPILRGLKSGDITMFWIFLERNGVHLISINDEADAKEFLDQNGFVYSDLKTTGDVIIASVSDDTDLKQEKYIPGTGIQIHSREYLKNNNVDYILILAHNFKDIIIESLKDEYKGKFIVLFPKPEII
jgi:hypothetical protein